MLPNRRQLVGKLGETKAGEYLVRNGYQIIEKNFRTRYGEIDIIAKDGNDLVFVEVRSRSTKSFGAPEESITAKKQLKIKNLAQYYLQVHNLNRVNCRFDVVVINFNRNGKLERLNHIRSAF